MSSVSVLLSTHHASCDRELALARDAAGFADWARCGVCFERFRSELSRHIRLEEDVLFPAFERATGGREGPTAVMRREHRGIVDLMDALAQAIAAADGGRFEGACVDFHALMGDHNAKEERILYPACDRVLGAELPLVVEQIHRLLGGG